MGVFFFYDLQQISKLSLFLPSGDATLTRYSVILLNALAYIVHLAEMASHYFSTDEKGKSR